MSDTYNIEKTMDRLKQIRLQLVREYPFFGELLMNLSLAVADVQTACTDGKHLIVDPAFAKNLPDEELQFIFMHEIMHVVFLHCFRRGGRDSLLWNIACDYTVNSNVILALGLDEFEVDGRPVFHRINGEEAAGYTADEIYDMLLDKAQKSTDMQLTDDLASPDSHEIWEELEGEALQDQIDRWKQIELDATRKWYGKGVGVAAGSLRRYEDHCYRAQLKWKQIVRDFIRHRSIEEDYGFRPPDRRFQEEEFIYPGLNEAESEVVENIWLFIDKSGSISRHMLLSIIDEIEFGLKQVRNMSGLVSFFDSEVTEPIPFEDLRSFLRIGIPAPGGGTSFHEVFHYAAQHARRYDPKGIIVLTDGEAQFPEHNPLPRIPCLWVIADNPQLKPAFGKAAYIDTESIRGK